MENQEEPNKRSKTRLERSYKKAREDLQVVEIELNRSSIALINEKGEVIRIPVLHQH